MPCWTKEMCVLVLIVVISWGKMNGRLESLDCDVCQRDRFLCLSGEGSRLRSWAEPAPPAAAAAICCWCLSWLSADACFTSISLPSITCGRDSTTWSAIWGVMNWTKPKQRDSFVVGFLITTQSINSPKFSKCWCNISVVVERVKPLSSSNRRHWWSEGGGEQSVALPDEEFTGIVVSIHLCLVAEGVIEVGILRSSWQTLRIWNKK